MAPNPKACISAFWTLIGAVLAVAFFIFPEVFDQVVMEAEAFKVGKGSAATALKALDVDNLGVACPNHAARKLALFILGGQHSAHCVGNSV